jgi:hypothetical protein
MKNQLIIVLLIWFIVLGLAVDVCNASSRLSDKEEKMKTTMKLNQSNASNFSLSVNGLNKEVMHIFAVPVENAIGTNDIDNSLTVLKFIDHAGKIEYETRLKDFLKYVSGGDLHFLPVLSRDTIGYAQTRRFIFFNFSNNTFVKRTICDDIEETVSDVGVINAEKKIFVFEIESSEGKVPGMLPDKILRTIDLSAEQREVSASLPLKPVDRKKSLVWFIQNSIVFIYKDNVLEAFNTSFIPLKHPFVELLHENKDTVTSIESIFIHPNLPFAIVAARGMKDGTNYSVWLASWKNNEKPHIVPLIKKREMISYSDFEFSPDGKWLVFQEKNPEGGSNLFITPVKSDLPYFLGDKSLLGKLRYPLGTAWISKPLSFVVTEGKKIFKWTLIKN